MAEVFTRAFTPELEVLTRAKGGDGRTIAGIAVPYGVPQRINPHLTEQFARGAFNAQIRAARRIPFSREHLVLGGTLIGRAVLLRDDPVGLYGEFRVSATPAGEETLELVRDGALEELSVAFREGQNKRLPGGVTERITAELREVAVVMEGAYGELAAVAGVRSAAPPEPGSPRLDQARQLLAGLPTLPGVE
ncbi:prohead peptidase [Prauserella shujinwangii]|uniref:Prohead peptidase n=1 Tax=Prauserella shujinwangii TaxID=1453103 RepID=A0A2T0LXD5_9PSEU|nr:HK97 family phage prohead protease [Prauserella shujinwangii]PRX48678.1 prohead peptidase [Prauserella shujinwangii]